VRTLIQGWIDALQRTKLLRLYFVIYNTSHVQQFLLCTVLIFCWFCEAEVVVIYNHNNVMASKITGDRTKEGATKSRHGSFVPTKLGAVRRLLRCYIEPQFCHLIVSVL